MDENPFQSGKRSVVPASLIYGRAEGLVMMLHRNASEHDIHQGKWNGLGGKFEIDESPQEAAQREFKEESGIDLPENAFSCLGVLQFPNFNPRRNEDWIVYVFEASVNEEIARPGLFRASSEGDIHWIHEREVLDLPLWEGDREFLPRILGRQPFFGTYWYEGGSLQRSRLDSFGEYR